MAVSVIWWSFSWVSLKQKGGLGPVIFGNSHLCRCLTEAVPKTSRRIRQENSGLQCSYGVPLMKPKGRCTILLDIYTYLYGSYSYIGLQYKSPKVHLLFGS